MEQHIHHSNLIEGINDAREDKQSLIAWRYLIAHRELTNDVICKVQKIITLHQRELRPDQRGYYRDLSKTQVTIGGKLGAHYSIVPHLMNNWLLDQGKHTAIQNHIRFEHIHPFVDGNGRVGRMLVWWQDRQQGFEPRLFDIRNRKDYYKLFAPEKPSRTIMTDEGGVW